MALVVSNKKHMRLASSHGNNLSMLFACIRNSFGLQLECRSTFHYCVSVLTWAICTAFIEFISFALVHFSLYISHIFSMDSLREKYDRVYIFIIYEIKSHLIMWRKNSASWRFFSKIYSLLSWFILKFIHWI